MRLLLVYPGALYSTIDVARGYHRAFKRIEGLKLYSFQYEKYLTYHDFALKFIMGKDYDPNKTIEEASKHIALRILECEPDWVLFISGIAFPTFAWQFLRDKVCAKLRNPPKIAVLFTEAPYIADWETGILERIQQGFTTDYGVLETYRKVNPNLDYIKHAYDPEVHFRDDTKRNGMFFVGTGFPERQRLLEQIDWTGIDLQLWGNWMYMGTSQLAKYLKGTNLDNVDTAQKYRECKIALNIFRTVQWPTDDPKFIEPSSAKSLSPRCYEAMACGAMLLTDWREELETLPKDSYVLWGDARDLEEKMRYYLSHDEERERIAEKGYQAIQGETFDKRATQILKTLGEHNGPSSMR